MEKNTGEFLFGITSGLLSLVGLIAIYVTINGQQNIQKAKEYIWELQSYLLLNSKFDDRTFKRINWIKKHYTELQKVDLPLILVVFVGGFILLLCGTAWSFYGWLNKPISIYLTILLISALLVLLAFIIFLYILTKTSVLGNLPNPKELFSIYSKEQGINMGEIIFQHAAIKIEHIEKENAVLTVELFFPFEVELEVLDEFVFWVADEASTQNYKKRNISYVNRIKNIKGRMVYIFVNADFIDSNGDYKDINLVLDFRDTLLDPNTPPYLRAVYNVTQENISIYPKKINIYPNQVLSKEMLNVEIPKSLEQSDIEFAAIIAGLKKRNELI